MLQHLAAANPGHVSNLKYATETWTPGGTALALVIIVALIWVWIKLVPSGPKAGRRAKPAPARKAWERARVPAGRK